MRQRQKADHLVRAFLTIGTLYSCLYCMLASNVLFSMPVLGGALYLAGQTAVYLSAQLRHGKESALGKWERRGAMILLLLLLILLFALFTVYPVRLESADFWRLAGIVLCMVVRPNLVRYVTERSLIENKKFGPIFLRILGVQLLFLPPLLLMLLLSPLERGAVWALLGGYLVSGILESFPLRRMRPGYSRITEEDRQEIEAMRGVHAYRVFQILMLHTQCNRKIIRPCKLAGSSKQRKYGLFRGSVAA